MRYTLLLIVALVLSACGSTPPQTLSTAAPSPSAAPVAVGSTAAPPSPSLIATPTLVPTLPVVATATLAAPTAAAVPSATPTPDTPTPPPLSAAPTQTSAPNPLPADNGDLLFYLENDGRTIATIRPDGSNRQLVTVIDKPDQQRVTGMTASPDGTYLIYQLSDDTGQPQSFLVSGGVPSLLPGVTTRAEWFGNRFVAGKGDGSATRSSVSIFDLSSGSPVEQPLKVDGSVPTWSANGSRIIYLDPDGNVTAIDPQPGAQPTTLLYLNPPETANAEPGSEAWNEGWDVSWVTQAEDDITLLFAGAQRKDRGASGNGERIWSFQGVPGSAGVQPLTDVPTRYNAGDYDFLAPDTLVAGSNGHNSACAVDPLIQVQPIGSNATQQIDLPLGNKPYSYVHDISAAPYRADRGSAFAFSVAPYDCADVTAIDQSPPALYVWSSPGGGTPQITNIADGRFPVWIDTGTRP